MVSTNLPFISAKIEESTTLVGFGKAILTLDGYAAFEQVDKNS